MRTVLALTLITIGGWLTIAVITNQPVVPTWLTTGVNNLGKTPTNTQSTTSNPPGNQTSRFGPYPA